MFGEVQVRWVSRYNRRFVLIVEESARTSPKAKTRLHAVEHPMRSTPCEPNKRRESSLGRTNRRRMNRHVAPSRRRQIRIAEVEQIPNPNECTSRNRSSRPCIRLTEAVPNIWKHLVPAQLKWGQRAEARLPCGTRILANNGRDAFSVPFRRIILAKVDTRIEAKGRSTMRLESSEIWHQREIGA